eukprot:GHUV01020226.1.p1 GENE.GHUV01020226.1~~GHUV01020226.1.p1  ORF type:complete len:135 (+),score=24.94 GHUV01020226.1:517-921(+)
MLMFSWSRRWLLQLCRLSNGLSSDWGGTLCMLPLVTIFASSVFHNATEVDPSVTDSETGAVTCKWLFGRLVMEHGEGNWSAIARCLNTMFSKSIDEGRIGKQCRERWNHHLRPDIRKDAWTEEEEQQLVAAHKT